VVSSPRPYPPDGGRPVGPAHRYARLDNGVQVVGVPLPNPSVCFALYLGSGSMHEPAELNGITHVIEHLFFKGSRRRSGAELAEVGAALGAEANAFTWHLGVCCHARVLRRHWAACLDLLVEQMTEPEFTEPDWAAERPVVLHEKARMEANPKVVAIQAVMTARYPDHPLGRPVVGTDATLARIRVADVRRYFERILRPDRLTLVVAGGFDWERVYQAARQALSGLSARTDPVPAPPPVPEPVCGMTVQHTGAFPNVHLAYGIPVPGYRDPDYFAGQLLGTVLGDETRTSSRLLLRVQQRDLAHDVFAAYQAFHEDGIIYTYAATTPDRAGAAHRAVLDEFGRLGDIEPDELHRACRKLVSRIAVDGETSQKRALAAARLFTGSGRLDTLEQLTERFRAVTVADLHRLVATYRPERSWVGVAFGPLSTL